MLAPPSLTPPGLMCPEHTCRCQISFLLSKTFFMSSFAVARMKMLSENGESNKRNILSQRPTTPCRFSKFHLDIASSGAAQNTWGDAAQTPNKTHKCCKSLLALTRARTLGLQFIKGPICFCLRGRSVRARCIARKRVQGISPTAVVKYKFILNLCESCSATHSNGPTIVSNGNFSTSESLVDVISWFRMKRIGAWRGRSCFDGLNTILTSAKASRIKCSVLYSHLAVQHSAECAQA